MTSETVNSNAINNPLSYRSKLTIPNNVNFGLEIELEDIDSEGLKYYMNKQFPNWQIKEDNSLKRGYSAELVSPVLTNTKETWLLIKKIGELLAKIKPTYDHCSFQINYDGILLPSTKDKIRFLKLYAMYEDIIYSFSKGFDKEYRDSLDMYASPIILALKDTLRFTDENLILEYFSEKKQYGINYKNKDKELIEFRTPNGTSDIRLWQNYITLFYYLIKFATNPKYPKSEIDKYIDNFNSIYILEKYDLIRITKAFELSNQIFTNSQDKNYFMQQYLHLK